MGKQIEHRSSNSVQRTLLSDPRNVTRGLNRRVAVILLFVVVSAEAGIGLLVLSNFKQSYSRIERMHAQSLRAVRQIGEMQYQVQAIRRNALYALTTKDATLRISYAEKSRASDLGLEPGLAKCLTQASTPEEVAAGRSLLSDWSGYLKVQDDVLSRILEGNTKEALEVDGAVGVPFFDKVTEDLEILRRLFDQRASHELAMADELSQRALVCLIAVLGTCLLFGILAVLFIERAFMKREARQAKLQMEFVASVSHELRTPVATIFSAAENIRDGLAPDGERLREQGAIITHQASKLNDFIEQVLLFTTQSKAGASHAMRPLMVSEIIESALNDSGRLLYEAGIKIVPRVDPGLPSVVGDLGSLSRCLQNLISNAVKYRGKQQWIGVFADLDDTHASERHVRIRVQDRGIGISESDLHFVFDPFFRSAQVVAEQIRGTGLGLAIAKRTAEAFGGTLSVESQIGVGSVFTLKLPALVETSRAVFASDRQPLGIGEFSQ